MATFDQVRKKIAQMSENVRKATPTIIAETATEYYKSRFSVKGWGNTPWPEAKNPPNHGTLMVRSGALVSTIRPSVISDDLVVISGGNAKVPYAKIHNEGGVIKQIPTPKQRKFFWAMEYKNNPTPEGQKKEKLGQWGIMAISKQLTINIPKRQFMGHSSELNAQILKRLKPLLKLN